MQQLDKLFEIIERKNVSILKFSKETGISSDKIYQWKAGRGKPKVEDYEKIQKWIIENTEQIPEVKMPVTVQGTATEQTDLQKLIDATLLAAQAAIINAEAWKAFGEAQKHDAINREQLTGMLREAQSTATVPEQMPEVVLSTLQGFRELLLEVAAGKKYRTVEEASAVLGKVTAAAAVKNGLRDTRKNSDK